jgi:AraC-like DNA-binding protein
MQSPDVLPLIDAALRGAAVALLALMGLRLWRDRSDAPAAQVGGIFMVGLCVQVLSSAPLFEARVPCGWQALPVGISLANSVLFWLFVQALFDDEFVLRPYHTAAWVAAVALGALACVLAPPGAPLTALGSAVLTGMRWVPLVFAALAVYAAARQWQVDLVERRRRLRIFVIVAGSAYTVGMALWRLTTGSGMLAPASALVDTAALLFIVAGVAGNVLTLRGSTLLAPKPQGGPFVQPLAAPPAARAEPPDPEQDKLLARLAHAMQQERAYRLENLTVASLADQLGVPQYRWRQAINDRLGFRNFNAYINSFRLEEAQQALADPAKRDLPVLTIALTAGFQSIGPFNRAFKAATGRTPTEFRQQNLADS